MVEEISAKRQPPPLIFDDKHVDILVFLDHDDPLWVKAFINNNKVHQLLVDIGSFTDIMFMTSSRISKSRCQSYFPIMKT